MKQIVQNLKTGATILQEVPAPVAGPGRVLIRTVSSLVSKGTEKMLVDFSKAGLLQKARQQPEKVKMVLDKIKSDGLLPTLETVFNRLDEPLPLGYCNAGVVVEVGPGVRRVKKGDRVISNGPHAEFVSVPENLVAHVPDEVTMEEAAFTVIASIGLQGIRLVKPELGEHVTVIGLGLIGLITGQLLLANGCRVTGIDIDKAKLELAAGFGMNVVPAGEDGGTGHVMEVTENTGTDAVIITASSKGNEIIRSAARMSRKRGRIVLVGVTGLDIQRSDFYEKELSFQVSCSYGPGRYDEQYEQKGMDYPLPFVRWTENRNFLAVLDSIAAGRLNVKPLISEVVPLEDYEKIYGNMGGSASIASILSYPEDVEMNRSVEVAASGKVSKGQGVIGIIGAGNFTKMTLMPALKKAGANIAAVCSDKGLSAAHLAKKYAVPVACSDHHELLANEKIDTVVITTRHHLHAPMVVEALEAGKNVFVEKPLALSEDELNEVISAYGSSGKCLAVGFNRRFSPMAERSKKILGGADSLMNIVITVNAGTIPPGVWVHDMDIGGGRILGEACHFIDLVSFLAGSPVEKVFMNAMGRNPEVNTDNAVITLKMKNGSQGVVNYFSNGHKSYPKERVEVYSRGRTLVIDNFRKMTVHGFSGVKGMSGNQDKGHRRQFEEYLKRIKAGGPPLIPFEEIVNTTRATFAALESLKTGAVVTVQ